jgi:hypothetical protein
VADGTYKGRGIFEGGQLVEGSERRSGEAESDHGGRMTRGDDLAGGIGGGKDSFEGEAHVYRRPGAGTGETRGKTLGSSLGSYLFFFVSSSSSRIILVSQSGQINIPPPGDERT